MTSHEKWLKRRLDSDIMRKAVSNILENAVLVYYYGYRNHYTNRYHRRLKLI